MNDKELLDLIAEDAPAPSADYPLKTLKRAQRVRLLRHLATLGGASVAIVVIALLATVALRPASTSLPPLAPPSVVGAEPSTVYLRGDVIEAQRAAVRAELTQTGGVSKVRFVNKQEAYESFKRQFADTPDLIASIRPDELTESFEFELAPEAQPRELFYRLRAMPGVDTVVKPLRGAEVASPRPTPTGPVVSRMGMAEAKVYARQISIMAGSVWPGSTPLQKIYVVGNVCTRSLRATCDGGEMTAEFKFALAAELANLGKVSWLEDGKEAAEQSKPDGVLVILDELGPRGAHPVEICLQVSGPARREDAAYAGTWDGQRWVVGRWLAGSVS